MKNRYLERYISGQHIEVWNELLALGKKTKEEPLSTEAYSVAKETMKRVRKNIEIIISRLKETDYEFGVYPDGTETIAY
jgi:hypothetical protein